MRWLDISLGVAAGIVSLVSLWLGIHSAHSMEKLVAANSYPYLTVEQSQTTAEADPGTDHFRGRVEYVLRNDGVGPAHLEWVTLSYKGRAMPDLATLFASCCAQAPLHGEGLIVRGSTEGLIRAGSGMNLFTWTEPHADNPLFRQLHAAMKDIAIGACYCSVFNECYLLGEDADKPAPVESCPAPKTAFQPTYHAVKPRARRVE
jgi:hypothetical protein